MPKKTNQKRATRRMSLDRDSAAVKLAGAEAALMTAILAMDNKGVMTSVAFTLRAHVLFPLTSLKDQLNGAPRA